MPDEMTTTGIAAGIYALARSIEMGFKKLIAVFKKAEDGKIKDKEESRTAAQFAEIQRELKIQNESHVQTRITLERVETRQEDMSRRVDTIEADVKTIKRKSGHVDEA